MSNIFDLTGKTAIVTGGYGHLGSAMVEILSEFGASVIVAGRSEEKYLKRFGKLDEGKISFRQLDITSSSSINELVVSVSEQYKQIDIVINNASSSAGNSQDFISDEDWSFTLDNSLGSYYKLIRAVLPIMKQQRSGKIINISSMYGMVSPDFSIYKGEQCEKYLNPPHYGAAKAGIIQLTKYYAVYLGAFNIQVNAISPGPFPKEGIQHENAEFVNRLKKKNPSGRIGHPDDIKGAIALLSSSASNFITGQNIAIDGGWTAW